MENQNNPSSLNQTNLSNQSETNTSHNRDSIIGGRDANRDITGIKGKKNEDIDSSLNEAGLSQQLGTDSSANQSNNPDASVSASASKFHEENPEFVDGLAPSTNSNSNLDLSPTSEGNPKDNFSKSGRFGTKGSFSTDEIGNTHSSGLGSNSSAGNDLDADEDPGNIQLDSTPV